MACEQIVAWLVEKHASAPANIESGFAWALAHCDDGVTWGCFDGEKARWLLGHDAVPEVSPPVRAEWLQELRVFGEHAEVLIWRSDNGLRGRILRDQAPDGQPPDETDPLRPSDEYRILRGDQVRPIGGEDAGAVFTWVIDRAGAQQVLPVSVDAEQLRRREIRLLVRHYWTQDAEIGTVRIAATRLVKLTTGGRDGR